MLDKPHDVRLHSWRASHGSYNLKDPPGSPTLKYPGPQWVPDNLRAAWCAAETLTHCLSRDASLTYKSAHWMLDSVLPDQCEHCEIGIELMLMDGHFTPEQAPCTRSYTDSSPLTPESMGLRKSLRRGSGSRAPCLQDNTLDKILVVIRKWWLNTRNGVMSLSICHATSENSLLRPFWLEHLSSLADIKPLERVVLTPAGPPMCGSPRLPKKSPIRKGDVSTEKWTGAIKYSPLPNVAIMLCKPGKSVSVTWTPPAFLSSLVF